MLEFIPMKQSNPRSLNPRLLQAEPMQRCKLHECRGACCLHGVWIDLAERDDLLANAELIAPHLPAALHDPRAWFDGREEADEFSPSGRVAHSTVMPDPDHYGGTACIFLREDYKCALQVAGQAAGLHPWRLKPFYCILHPLDLDEEGRITLDETSALMGEEGSCLRPAESSLPLLETFEAELRYFLGNDEYQRLK
jgi:hypothetical protein